METIDCIKTRRSRRIFLDKEVPQETINQILECAITAPSSKDCQPWNFVLIKEKEIKEKLAELKEEDNRQHLLTAPISIVVCVDLRKSSSRAVEDGITATQNILLAAHDLGLGSVYVTGFSDSKPEVTMKIKELLNLPENIKPITILPIGFPDVSEKLDGKTSLDINKIIHYNRWQTN